jgi:nucleoside-diphosphate kinase
LPTVTERTLVLIKPDAVRRGLIGDVLGRFERKGLTVVALDQRTIDGETADRHYAEHVERDFYPPLRAFITSGALVAMVLEGDQAIAVVRGINGATDGRAAAAGTIRGGLSRVGGPRDLDLLPQSLTDTPARVANRDAPAPLR